MNMRVLFVSQWFPPEPYLLPLDIARSLSEAGCEVTVLTGIPNYPSGNVIPGYHSWRGLTEEVEGLRVIRAPLFPSHDMSGSKRALNYLSFGATAAYRAVSTKLTFDVSLVFSSPITAALPALATQFFHRIPYVLMVQDLWPHVVYESGLASAARHKWTRAILDKSCLEIYQRASRCFAITPGMKSDLISMGVPSRNVDLFWNWGPSEGQEITDPPVSLRSRIRAHGDDLVLVYAGNMGATHALDSWVKAVIDREQDTAHPRKVHLVFLGDGVVRSELESLARERGSHSVHFLGRMTDDLFLAYRSQADAHIVSLVPSPVFDTSLPSKIPDTLAHGGLLIGAVRGDAATVITESGGIVAGGTSPNDIGRAISQLAALSQDEIHQRRLQGTSLYEQQMARTVGTQALLASLQDAANR